MNDFAVATVVSGTGRKRKTWVRPWSGALTLAQWLGLSLAEKTVATIALGFIVALYGDSLHQRETSGGKVTLCR